MGLRFVQLTAGCVNGYAYDGVSSIAFDAVEECIWAGSLTGTLYQQLTPTLDCHAALNTNQSSGPVLRVQTLGQSVAALSAGQMGVYMSGGACRGCYLDRQMDMSDMVYRHWNHQVLVGRSGVDYSGEAIDAPRSRHVFMYDVVRSSVISEFETAHPVALMAPLSSGQVVMASPTGDLMVFDPRQGDITGNGSVGQAKVFSHGFAALESSGNLIATSGYGGLAHRPVLEPFVKVFDSRMGIKALAAIPFSNGPSLLRFHPTLRSTVLACSSGGMFSMVDTSGTTLESYFVDMGGDSVSACDFNMNGDCIVFGGANGSVSLWGSENAAVTATGLVPEHAAPFDRSMVPYMDDTTSFSAAMNYAVHHRMEEQATASHVRPDEVMSVGLPPRVVDEALLASQSSKQVEFVTHIANPKYDENNTPGMAAAGVAAVRNKRVRHRRSGKEMAAAIDERARRRKMMGEVVLPNQFRRVSIKQQKGSRFEEFDFGSFNATSFSGLENGLANCYMNPLIQVLYFCRPLRDFAVGYAPDPEDEFSLLGEVSFVFQMLATADGEVCQASNLLRALRQTPEAVALGLLEGVKGERGAVDIAVEAQKDKNLVRRIERLCRLLLTRMDKEGGGTVADIFCLHQRQRTTCLTHTELPPKELDISTFQVELKYPKEAGPAVDFARVLGGSLETSNEIKAWFDQTVKYQPVRQQRCPTKLPQVLVTYTGLEDPSLIRFWEGANASSKFPYAVSIQYDKETGATHVVTAPDLVQLKGLCDDDIDDNDVDGGNLYLLTGVICYIYDKDEAEEMGRSYEGHLIAHINVPGNYSPTPLGAPAGNTSGDLGLRWITFNDFSITPCQLGDIQSTFDGQKQPVLLFFTKVDLLRQTMAKALQEPADVLSPDAFQSLCSAPPIQSSFPKRVDLAPRTFKPFSKGELIQKGDLFALDAEFVAYSAPEKMVMSELDDWSRASMRLGLGRVSLVRGSGPMAGVVAIDDYIQSVEPVYDHLTRYSGLLPGDLDVQTSRHHLTTLRKAYLKLRYLVDQGCIFVGHGLKKDFRMLNIVVPKDQIIDTMDLFWPGRGRRLSLKFLVAFFLGSSALGSGFQVDSHDSIEDATAALKLYKLYEKLTLAGKMEEALSRAIDWGLAAGWDPAAWHPAESSQHVPLF